MANTNAFGVQYVGDKRDAGNSLSQSGAKSSVYGETPVVQASAIPAITGTVNLTTTINALLTAVRNFGIIA